MMPGYCSTYCEHNAGGQCDCSPCTFIRTECGDIEHEPGCLLPDARLACRYFDEWILPGLTGLPKDGIRYLRERYVTDALASPEAVRQLRETYA